MLGMAVTLLGLATGWQADLYKSDSCKILECNPKLPSINEIETFAKCCDCPANWKKIVFFEAAHFPNPRFSETLQGNQPGCLPLPIPVGVGRADAVFPGVPGIPFEGIPTKYVVEQNGKPLIIHEGMAVMINRGGNYKVVFRATVPDTVIDLRLQLEFGVKSAFLTGATDHAIGKLSNGQTVFVDRQGDIRPASSLGAFKLSLPPIQLSRTPDNSVIFTTIPAEVNDRSRDVLVVLEGYSSVLNNFMAYDEPSEPAAPPPAKCISIENLNSQIEQLGNSLAALVKTAKITGQKATLSSHTVSSTPKAILEVTLTKVERNGTARFGSPITR